MSKKIIFSSQEEKDEAIAGEKTAHPNPTAYQVKHLADLNNAEVTG
jgi:hypothetical protein